MGRTLSAVLFVIYIIIGVVVASGHHYFEHLDAVKPIVSAGQPASQVDSGPGELSRTVPRSPARQPWIAPTVYGGAVGESESTTCPICGKGTLVTVEFGDQQPESREVQTFTCGHEVEGGRLRTAEGRPAAHPGLPRR